MATSTTVSDLKINKLTKAQYSGIEEPSNTELYFVTDEKEPVYEAGDGITIATALETTVNVACSNPDLTVTSSYDDTESSVGVITYEFEYREISRDLYSGGSKADTYSSYFILNGKLYRGDYVSSSTIITVDENDNWSFIGGDVNGAYGINNGKLYQINSAVATLVDSSPTWTFVNGSYNSTYVPYVYGIKGGQLYLIENTSISVLNSDTDWTYISGEYHIDSSSSYDYYCYALKGGKLYAIKGTTLSQIGSDNTWTAISGGCHVFKLNSTTTYTYQAYGINNGKLYEIYNTNIAQIGSDSTWTAVTGSSSSSSRYAFGINNGSLYALAGGAAIQVGESNTWSEVKGYSPVGNYYYTVGIDNGNLKVISGNLQVKAYGSDVGYSNLSNPNGNSTARVFVERDGKLFYFRDFQSSTGLMMLGFLGAIDSSKGWFLNDSVVNLSDYSLEVTGTPKIGDTINLTYTTVSSSNIYTISISGGA